MKELTLFHVGIAVPDVEFATVFFQRVFNFELLVSRTASHDYLGRLVGHQGVSAKINMLRIDENNLLEILEWVPYHSDIPKGANITNIFDRGAQHLCFYTEDAALIYSTLMKEDVIFLSNAPVTVEDGPNQGAQVFFIKVFGFLFIEIFQRPPSPPIILQ
jgi:catechol 2,3-dioxygenase-like lactoylglutathione lyase family enzyme